MKPTSPWSVKGVDPEAREAAKLAARRAGVPLGIWLSGTIRKAAAEQLKSGAPTPDFSQYAQPDSGYGPQDNGYDPSPGMETGGYGEYGPQPGPGQRQAPPHPEANPQGYGQPGYGQPGYGGYPGQGGQQGPRQPYPSHGAHEPRPARPPAPTTEVVLESINRLAAKIEENESRTAEAIAPIADRVRKLTDQIDEVKERQALESSPLERALARMQERLDNIDGGGGGVSGGGNAPRPSGPSGPSRPSRPAPPRDRRRQGGFFSRLFSD